MLRTLAPDQLAGVLARDARMLLDGADATGTTLAQRILHAHRALGDREALLLTRLLRLPGELSLADAETSCLRCFVADLSEYVGEGPGDFVTVR